MGMEKNVGDDCQCNNCGKDFAAWFTEGYTLLVWSTCPTCYAENAVLFNARHDCKSWKENALEAGNV